MASQLYSKFVLAGLQRMGLTPVGIARIARMSETRVESILAGKGGFTDGQLNAIEVSTGMTAGQIVITVVKPDKSLRAVVEAGARLHKSIQKPSRRSKRAVA